MRFPPFATEADALHLLRVAMRGAALATHDELRAWLAREVRAVLPHDAMLLAEGGFESGELQVDLLCPPPLAPLRPDLAAGVDSLQALARRLHGRWAGSGHLPSRIDDGPARSALVHGVRATPAGGRIVAALCARPYGEAQVQAMHLLVPFIDAVLRRAPPPPRPLRVRPRLRPLAPAGSHLSERERQIMAWVALGKTNPEIGCILCISEFTVKNHLKSIFAKLDVTNRAQAVARLTQGAAHA